MAESWLTALKARRGRQIKAGMWLIASLLLALLLFSYRASDPSFNRAANDDVANWLGRGGAYIADPILQSIGLSAVTIVLWPLVVGLRAMAQKTITYKYIRAIILCFALASSSALLSLLQPSEHWPFYVGYGGLLGNVLQEQLLPVLTVYGLSFAASAVLLASLYWGFAVERKEVVQFCRAIALVARIIYAGLANTLIFAINIFRRLFKKELLESKKPIVIEKDDMEDVVEFTPSAPKKRASPARQVALKLSSDQFDLPDLELLVKNETKKKTNMNQSSLEQNARLLQRVLQDFGVNGDILKVRPGPVVTLYELEPSPGTKSSRVIGLADDIARSMSSVSARIAVVPGRNVLGVELPNTDRETVYLRELLETEEYRDIRIKLPVALGKDIGGSPVVADLSRMPHLLVAGTTGSGKSVAVNAMILSFLYRLSPEECKFIMIDPKMLELSVYEGIPHLLAPVVTEPGKAVVALKWAVREMENRYRLMSTLSVRNVAGYNKRIEEAVKKGEKLERTVQTGFNPETGTPIYEKVPLDMNKLPYIVIIVDEMADLMLTAGKDIESSVQRLAQMARAAGLHLIMATQRPSVDVITGVIKANFPTRISFQVTSRIDSRTILGEMGAEQLLGMGDMLYMAGGSRITRVHGPFVDDKEVEKVVSYLKTQGTPSYIEEVTRDEEETFSEDASGGGGDNDLYAQAVAIVKRDRKASTSYIQRQLKIGYNRAANLIERMESEGIVSPANHAGKREVVGV